MHWETGAPFIFKNMARRKKKNNLNNKQLYFVHSASLVEIWDKINKRLNQKPTMATINLDIKDFENISYLEHV